MVVEQDSNMPREQADAVQPVKNAPEKSKQKGATIALSILIAVFVVISTALFVGKTKLQGENRKLAGELEAAMVRAAALQKQTDEVNAIKQRLEVDLTALRQQAEALNAQIAMEKQAKADAVTQLEAKVKENAFLRREVVKEKQARTEFEAALDNTKKESDRLSMELAQLKRAKESLEKKLKKSFASKGVELEKIVVKPQTSQPLTEGQVLVVNREFDFIVVNLGENDGLRIGSRLQVVKDADVLGEVEVEKIYGNMSAATILPDTDKDKIKEGCKVRLL